MSKSAEIFNFFKHLGHNATSFERRGEVEDNPLGHSRPNHIATRSYSAQ